MIKTKRNTVSLSANNREAQRMLNNVKYYLKISLMLPNSKVISVLFEDSGNFQDHLLLSRALISKVSLLPANQRAVIIDKTVLAAFVLCGLLQVFYSKAEG